MPRYTSQKGGFHGTLGTMAKSATDNQLVHACEPANINNIIIIILMLIRSACVFLNNAHRDVYARVGIPNA